MIKPLVKFADKVSDMAIDAVRAAMLLLPVLLYPGGSARAADSVTIVEEYDEEISYIDTPDELASETDGGSTLATSIARFGPFHVISAQKAVVTGGIDADGPQHFAQMMARYPGLKTLELADCPGSVDDDANLALGRMIRRAGIATYVPANGSVRSGGVELFLAGATRSAEPQAEFGVHSWGDDEGNTALSVPENDPVHQRYLRYYREMGLSAEAAKAFYDFTNRAAPPEGLHVMSAAEKARYGVGL
jgi:hypothetical protein